MRASGTARTARAFLRSQLTAAQNGRWLNTEIRNRAGHVTTAPPFPERFAGCRRSTWRAGNVPRSGVSQCGGCRRGARIESRLRRESRARIPPCRNARCNRIRATDQQWTGARIWGRGASRPHLLTPIIDYPGWSVALLGDLLGNHYGRWEIELCWNTFYFGPSVAELAEAFDGEQFIWPRPVSRLEDAAHNAGCPTTEKREPESARKESPSESCRRSLPLSR